MRILSKASIILIYYTLATMAKGGGGGKGGIGGGGKGGNTGNTGGGTGGYSGNVGRGGSGNFRSSAPPAYSNTKGTYTNYRPAYSGPYTPSRGYGSRGIYNPALIYFAVAPAFLYWGYSSAYRRYNDDGYYYAPELRIEGENTNSLSFIGSANDGEDINFQYIFNMATTSGYPVADHAFFASSDPAVKNADFAYGHQFVNIIEFEDVNQNGFYDDNEPILSVSSLQNLNWNQFSVKNITVPTDDTRRYLETSISAPVNYNNTGVTSSTTGNFTVRITYRTSNIQVKNIAPITIQPNSLQYDFTLDNFQSAVAATRPNVRLAIGQILSSKIDSSFLMDVNKTTPIDIANAIKSNATYGVSIGEYVEGRIEYQNSVNITDVETPINTWTPIDINTFTQSAYYTNPDGKIWASADRQRKLVMVTMPSNSYSGSGFLDTDIMNSMALSSGSGGSISGGGDSLSLPYLPILLLFMSVYLLV